MLFDTINVVLLWYFLARPKYLQSIIMSNQTINEENPIIGASSIAVQERGYE